MIPARRRAAAVLLATIGLLATPWAGAQAATPTPSGPSPGDGRTTGIISSADLLGSGSHRALRVNLSASQLVDGVATPQDISKVGATVSIQPVNGSPSVKRATVNLATDEQQNRTIVLALDISGSIKKNLQAEKDAAKTFVDGLPHGTKVGIVTFGSPARLAQKPTSDHGTVLRRINQLYTRPTFDTDLYGAIALGAKLLASKAAARGQRLLVVVTDGDNDPYGDGRPARTATEKADSATKKSAAMKATRANFYGVIIGQTDRQDLKNIAPDGRVLDSSRAAASVGDKIDAIFKTSGDAFGKEATLTVPVDPSIFGTVKIIASVSVGDRRVSAERAGLYLVPDSSPTSSAQAAPVGTVARPSWINEPVMLGALAAVFIAMTVLLTTATGALRGAGADAETPLTRALSFYSVRNGRPQQVALTQAEQAGPLSGSRIARTAISAINRLARSRQLDRALDARLEAAGLPIRTAEWSLLHVGSGIGGGLLLLIASRGMVLGAVLGLVLGLVGPWLFLILRTGRRETRFLAQLPDTLQLLAGSLAAGYSLPQAMDAVLREAQPPISEEFNRALVETRLGVPPEDALDAIAGRTGSRDFSWIVMAIRIQRDVGGNLAELLSSVADTLRERERLRRQVKALSAEGRLSGIILGSLPLIFALFLIFTKPDYIAPLFQTPIGWALLIVGSVLLVVGSIWMAKTVKVEV